VPRETRNQKPETRNALRDTRHAARDTSSTVAYDCPREDSSIGGAEGAARGR
jgi:hypothetical protein